MQTLFSFIQPQDQPRWLKASAWATAVMFALLTFIGRSLSDPAASPLGMLSFEFAARPERAQRILAAWGEAGRLQAAFSLGLDYVFILVYPLFFGLLCRQAAGRASGGWVNLGVWLGWGQGLAAGCDVIENIALMRILHGFSLGEIPGAFWTGLAACFAAIKFGLIALAVLYWLSTLRPRRNLRAPQAYITTDDKQR